jgi:hypothetical protein
MTIEALVQVLPPPEAPTASFSGSWGPVEAELGTRLPQDYKDFVRLFGSGYLFEFMGINVPYSGNPNVRLVSEARAIYRIFIDDDELEQPLWPVPAGLLPFGSTDNGDYLFWKTKGDPDDWTVAIWSRGDVAFEFLDCGLTDFLAGLATGTNIPQCLPDDLLPCKTPFRPSPATDPKASSRPQVPLSGSQSPRFGPVEIRRSFAWRSTF